MPTINEREKLSKTKSKYRVQPSSGGLVSLVCRPRPGIPMPRRRQAFFSHTAKLLPEATFCHSDLEGTRCAGISYLGPILMRTLSRQRAHVKTCGRGSWWRQRQGSRHLSRRPRPTRPHCQAGWQAGTPAVDGGHVQVVLCRLDVHLAVGLDAIALPDLGLRTRGGGGAAASEPHLRAGRCRCLRMMQRSPRRWYCTPKALVLHNIQSKAH